MGYRTETASDGIDVLEKVTAWSPGIVVKRPEDAA